MNASEESPLRRSPHAGTWYPAEPARLSAMVHGMLEAAAPGESGEELVALVSPHAGLRYSGPVAAAGYRAIGKPEPQTALILGPSHHVRFDGISIYPGGGFETPLGVTDVDSEIAERLQEVEPSIHHRRFEEVHRREHCLEMQLPFLQEIAPESRIVPLVMGVQTRSTVERCADAIVRVVSIAKGRVLLVASSDLSHYETRPRARELDQEVCELIESFEPDALQGLLEREPGHACGGGPIVTIMRAAAKLGATQSRVLRYGDSGDVTGDIGAVVGYLSAAFTRPR